MSTGSMKELPEPLDACRPVDLSAPYLLDVGGLGLRDLRRQCDAGLERRSGDVHRGARIDGSLDRRVSESRAPVAPLPAFHRCDRKREHRHPAVRKRPAACRWRAARSEPRARRPRAALRSRSSPTSRPATTPHHGGIHRTTPAHRRTSSPSSASVTVHVTAADGQPSASRPWSSVTNHTRRDTRRRPLARPSDPPSELQRYGAQRVRGLRRRGFAALRAPWTCVRRAHGRRAHRSRYTHVVAGGSHGQRSPLAGC